MNGFVPYYIAIHLSNRQPGLAFFTHKKYLGGVSFHRIYELFPLKPSLETFCCNRLDAPHHFLMNTLAQHQFWHEKCEHHLSNIPCNLDSVIGHAVNLDILFFQIKTNKFKRFFHTFLRLSAVFVIFLNSGWFKNSDHKCS